MVLVAEVAKDFYSNDLRGGEGHMEVGKLIVNTVHQKAHMTVSVKPFGCMPSSGVSDGVQSLITARHPGSIFCAVETSGEGATNFYSRVQMYLFKARQLAEAELQKAYADCGVTEAQVREFLAANPRYGNPFHHPPHKVAGTAANLVYEVAPLITMSLTDRTVVRALGVVSAIVEQVKKTPERLAAVRDFATAPETHERLKADAEVLWDLARGKAKERFGPLMSRLSQRAVFEHHETR